MISGEIAEKWGHKLREIFEGRKASSVRITVTYADGETEWFSLESAYLCPDAFALMDKDRRVIIIFTTEHFTYEEIIDAIISSIERYTQTELIDIKIEIGG